jgi:SAM-dependent methyltransferase
MESLHSARVRLARRAAAGFDRRQASVDFISSTATLEHIPAPDVLPILVECRRLLKPTGVLSCTIDLQDHYSYFDKTLTRYHFLTFSSRAWRIANPPLGHQNRLRYPDYVGRFREAGFEIVAKHVQGPTARDLATLRTLSLAAPFRAYALEVVGIRRLSIVARPSREESTPNAASP